MMAQANRNYLQQEDEKYDNDYNHNSHHPNDEKKSTLKLNILLSIRFPIVS